MKQILFTALAVLFFSCGSAKQNAQKDNDAKQWLKKPQKNLCHPILLLINTVKKGWLKTNKRFFLRVIRFIKSQGSFWFSQISGVI